MARKRLASSADLDFSLPCNDDKNYDNKNDDDCNKPFISTTTVDFCKNDDAIIAINNTKDDDETDGVSTMICKDESNNGKEKGKIAVGTGDCGGGASRAKRKRLNSPTSSSVSEVATKTSLDNTMVVPSPSVPVEENEKAKDAVAVAALSDEQEKVKENVDNVTSSNEDRLDGSDAKGHVAPSLLSAQKGDVIKLENTMDYENKKEMDAAAEGKGILQNHNDGVTETEEKQKDEMTTTDAARAIISLDTTKTSAAAAGDAAPTKQKEAALSVALSSLSSSSSFSMENNASDPSSKTVSASSSTANTAIHANLTVKESAVPRSTVTKPAPSQSHNTPRVEDEERQNCTALDDKFVNKAKDDEVSSLPAEALKPKLTTAAAAKEEVATVPKEQSSSQTAAGTSADKTSSSVETNISEDKPSIKEASSDTGAIADAIDKHDMPIPPPTVAPVEATRTSDEKPTAEGIKDGNVTDTTDKHAVPMLSSTSMLSSLKHEIDDDDDIMRTEPTPPITVSAETVPTKGEESLDVVTDTTVKHDMPLRPSPTSMLSLSSQHDNDDIPSVPLPPTTVSTDTVPEGVEGESSSISSNIHNDCAAALPLVVDSNNLVKDEEGVVVEGRVRSATTSDLSLILGEKGSGGRERSATATDLSLILGEKGADGRERSATATDLSLIIKEDVGGNVGRERSGTATDLSLIIKEARGRSASCDISLLGDGDAGSTFASAAHHDHNDGDAILPDIATSTAASTSQRPRSNSTCTVDSKNLFLMGIVATGAAAESVIQNSRPRRLSFDLPPLMHDDASAPLDGVDQRHDNDAKYKRLKRKGPPRKRSFDLPMLLDDSGKTSSASSSRQRKASFDLSLLHDDIAHHDDAGLIAAAATVASLGSIGSGRVVTEPKEDNNAPVAPPPVPRDDASHAGTASVSEDTVGAAIRAAAAAFDSGGSGHKDIVAAPTQKDGATAVKLEANNEQKKVGTALDHLDALGASEPGNGSEKRERNEKADEEDEAAVAVVRSAAKALDDNSSSSGGATLDPTNHRLLLEALMGGGGGGSAVGGYSGVGEEVRQRRQRFESWGGMSDLSVAGVGGGSGGGSTGSETGSDAAAAVAASALQHTGIIDDVEGAAAACENLLGSLGSLAGDESIGEDQYPPPVSQTAADAAGGDAALSIQPPHPHQTQVPINLHIYGGAPSPRARIDSLASLSEASMSFGTHVASSTSRSRSNSHAADMFDMNSIVAAAMATVSDQIAEIASAVEASAEMATSAMNEKSGAGIKKSKKKKKASSSTVKANASTVDYDAVAAAVTAATSSAIDISSIAGMPVPGQLPSSPSPAMVSRAVGGVDATPLIKNTARSRHKKRHNSTPQSVRSSAAASSCATPSKSPVAGPLHSNVPLSYPAGPLPPSTTPSKDMEEIRARARAAAGYVPPPGVGTPSAAVATPSPRQPIKKRGKRASSGGPPAGAWAAHSQDPSRIMSSPTAYGAAGPRSSSAPSKISFVPPSVISAPPRRSASATASKGGGGGGGGQSNQKWDDMLECLIKYKEEQRELATKGMTEKEKAEWEWEGNVPTTYKTPSGKALGRWINNQRSAKSKGTLKREREVRLVSTGLKWSVLSTNAWPDMMQELRLYVKEKTKDGQPWDGNVPTNYRIKGNTAPDGTEIDEDKNLGRWINRQRSLFQAGKLKKHRQLELEKIGLKWSVLSTTSWQVMYDALCQYAEMRRKEDPNNHWDGNVPANYKTPDNPPKSLGRWVNRQRSAYSKDRLKEEFVEKLARIGLKWSVHEKKANGKPYAETAKGQKSGRSSPVPSSQPNVASNANKITGKGKEQGKSVAPLAQQKQPVLAKSTSNQGGQPIVASNAALNRPKSDPPLAVKTES